MAVTTSSICIIEHRMLVLLELSAHDQARYRGLNLKFEQILLKPCPIYATRYYAWPVVRTTHTTN